MGIGPFREVLASHALNLAPTSECRKSTVPIESMHSMNLSAIDLNLLVVLDALLETRSTTRAAKRLALSQPATSHALGRLRELFGDPLLVREGRGLAPTPFAVELAPRVRAALEAVRSAVSGPSRFDPRTSSRVFTMGTGDYAASVLLPKLAARLAAEAPKVELFVKPYADASTETLAGDVVELVCGPPVTGPRPAWARSEILFEERFVCLVRKDHPLGRGRLTLDRYCALPHVLVAPRGTSREGAVDEALARLGRRRRVAVALPSFFVAPQIVRETDYVLTLAEHVARDVGRFLGLRLLEPPVDLEGFSIAMHWHARHDADEGHRFFRDAVRASASMGRPKASRAR